MTKNSRSTCGDCLYLDVSRDSSSSTGKCDCKEADDRYHTILPATTAACPQIITKSDLRSTMRKQGYNYWEKNKQPNYRLMLLNMYDELANI